MKKIILTVAAVFALSFANAQEKKEGGAGLASGDVVLTGNMGFASETKGDLKSSGFVLSPGLGYMMSDNLMLLGQVSIKSGSGNETLGNDAKSSGLALGAGVRYFFTPADNFSLSLGGQLSYSSDKTNVLEVLGVPTLLTTDQTTKTIGLSVPVGLHYFMNDNFAINATWGGLGYSSAKVDVANAKATNTMGLGLTMSSVSFGLLYKL
jgi:outer membrane protein